MERQTERGRAKKSSGRPATGRAPAQAGSEASPESSQENSQENSPENRGPDRIRVLAYEIYETRSSSGMLGDPVSDWLEAERRLAESESGPHRKEAAGDASPETRQSRSRARRQPAGK